MKLSQRKTFQTNWKSSKLKNLMLNVIKIQKLHNNLQLQTNDFMFIMLTKIQIY